MSMESLKDELERMKRGHCLTTGVCGILPPRKELQLSFRLSVIALDVILSILCLTLSSSCGDMKAMRGCDLELSPEQKKGDEKKGDERGLHRW